MSKEQPDEAQLLAQQRALAEFGELALRSENLDEILTESCRLVGDGLRTELAKVVEFDPVDGVLLVRAGIGWHEGIVGHVAERADADTSAAYALRAGEPIVSRDTSRESRFQIEEFLRDHGVQALVNVPIKRPDAKPAFGILEVDSRTPRRFTADDVSFLRGYANLLGTAVARLQLLHDLRAAVADKERLLDEVQHRVRNNLQVILGLIEMQAARSNADEVRQELFTLQQRLEALRLVHDRLYTTGHVGPVDLGGYLGELASGLVRFHGARAQNVRLHLDLSHLVVSAEQAIPAALIVNEFITNSIKHAFDDTGGDVGLELGVLGADRAVLHLWDTGKGIRPPEARHKGGSGMRLIEGLARQMGGTPEWKAGTGTRLEIAFVPSRP